MLLRKSSNSLERKMTIANVDNIIADFEHENDLVGLWQIVAAVKNARPEFPEEQVMDATIHLVERLLRKGFEVGDPPYSRDGYRRWLDQCPQEVVKRIQREWLALGHQPDIADIAWFRPPAMNH